MAKKRIPEVQRDGSEVDFIPQNFMLIDGADGSAKMRMDLFAKASSVESLRTDVSGKADKVTGATEGDVATLDTNGNLVDSGKAVSDFAASSHTHGNIQNGGTLQTNDITIANGDKLVVTDSSDSSKVARASIAFDGSTTTQVLTKAGTWATFNNYSHPAGSAPSKTGVPTANATPGFGGTFKVNQITTDATSHVSAVTERTITIPNTTATTSADGLMSAADKTKLDGIAAGTASPLMDGKASVGNSLKYAREDHVHPSDTSKEDIVNKTTVVLGTSDSKYPTDKAVAEFVNSSIATNTANYISNNGEPFTSVEQLEAYSGPVTNNDYAFVTGTDSDGNTYYDRYKATVSGSNVTWALEYRLNNSSFTAAQWSAINSGITSVLVAKIHEHGNKAVLDGITSSDVANWNSKMDKQTVGNASEPVYIENGIAKVATNVATNGKLNVDGSNATTAGVTTMMKKVDSGTDKLNDDNTYFGDSNADHAHIVRRPILNLWDYIKNKVMTQLLGSVGSVDKPIYLVNGVPKVCNTNYLNVDGSNSTNEGVTAMMKKVSSGSDVLNDDSTYFGDSNADHAYIVRRPILNLWNYIKNKVQTQLLGSVGSADTPIYLVNGVPKVCNDKLNVDGSNATTVGVTSMMKKVESGSADLNDNSYYFGDSNADHAHIVRRPILDIWNYFAPKVNERIAAELGSVGSEDKPIYLENGVPKVCADGVPYSSVSYGGSVGYGVFVGGITNLANTTISYCSFLVSVMSDPDKIDNTYIGTFTFSGKTLKSELRCLTGTPQYPLRIVVVSNKDGGTTENPTYNVGLYVIPATKTYKYSTYKLTRIASSSFNWDVHSLSLIDYDNCDEVSRNVFMTQTAMIKDVANASTTDTNPVHIYYDDIICNNGTTAYTINISRLVIGKTYRFHIMNESQAATYLYNYGETSSGTVTIYYGDQSTNVTKNVRFALNGSGTGTSDHTITVARMTETQIYVIWGY